MFDLIVYNLEDGTDILQHYYHLYEIDKFTINFGYNRN